MDKFTKTTEIDISAMNEMEDETPKKSNVGTVIALIICLIASIFIWLLVMETDTTLIEKQFDDVSVQVVGEIEGYDIIVSPVDINVKATRSDMADLTKDDIKLTFTVAKYNINKGVTKTVILSADDIKIVGEGEGEWIPSGPIEVKVQVVKK